MHLEEDKLNEHFVYLFGTCFAEMVLAGEAKFQLRFGPIQHCLYWSVSDTECVFGWSIDCYCYPHRLHKHMKLTLI